MIPTEFKPKRRTDRDTIAYAEFTGLRNDVTPERFDATDLATANNVDIDKARRIRRRAGATLRSNLAAHSLWAAGDIALFMSGTTLHSLDAALTPQPLRTGLSGAPVSYARVGDAVFYSDGAQCGVVDGSAVRSWGLDAPALMTPVLVAGDLTPGTYGFMATYLRSDGQESGASEPQYIAVGANQSAYLNALASLDPDVTHKRIYMTTPDGEVFFHAATMPNTDTPFTPTTADVAATNEPLETDNLGPPPAGQLVAYYKGRMYVAAGSVLYPSEPFAYELFDLRNYIQLDAPITMLAPMEDKAGSGFFIGTTNSTGTLGGDSPDEFKYAPKAEYGAVKGALAYIDASLYLDGSMGARELPMWLSTQGVCVGLPSLEVNNLTRIRYTFPVSDQGAAMFDPATRRFVAVSETQPAIVVQTENMTLTTYTNYGFNSFARVGGKNVGARDDGLFELVGEDDNGRPISGTVALGVTDFGSTFLKTVDRLFVGYRARAEMVLGVKTEETHNNLYPLPASPALATQRAKVGRGLSARYWQFTLQNLDGTDFAIDTVDVKSAKLERRINGRA